MEKQRIIDKTRLDKKPSSPAGDGESGTEYLSRMLAGLAMPLQGVDSDAIASALEDSISPPKPAGTDASSETSAPAQQESSPPEGTQGGPGAKEGAAESTSTGEGAYSMIGDFFRHIPKERLMPDYSRAPDAFSVGFARELMKDPDATVLELYRFMLLLSFTFLSHSCYAFHQLTRPDMFTRRDESADLPETVLEEWAPRFERQQEALVRLIDAYTRTKRRLQRIKKAEQEAEDGGDG